MARRDTLECYLEELVDCVQEFVQKSIVAITMGIISMVLLFLYMLRTINERCIGAQSSRLRNGNPQALLPNRTDVTTNYPSTNEEYNENIANNRKERRDKRRAMNKNNINNNIESNDDSDTGVFEMRTKRVDSEYDLGQGNSQVNQSGWASSGNQKQGTASSKLQNQESFNQGYYQENGMNRDSAGYENSGSPQSPNQQNRDQKYYQGQQNMTNEASWHQKRVAGSPQSQNQKNLELERETDNQPKNSWWGRKLVVGSPQAQNLENNKQNVDNQKTKVPRHTAVSSKVCPYDCLIPSPANQRLTGKHPIKHPNQNCKRCCNRSNIKSCNANTCQSLSNLLKPKVSTCSLCCYQDNKD